MAWPFRRIVRAIWWVLVALLLLAFPLLVWAFNSSHRSTFFQAWFYAGVFVLLTLPVTFYEVAMHLEYFTSPLLQKFVIRIHWLVPIYALDAWLALHFYSAEIYINPLRECYEAYTIYNFYSYLVAFLDSEVGDLETHMMLKPPFDHMWGFQFVCERWKMGRQFIWECKKGILNYVILRPITAVMGMVAEALDFYKSGRFWPDGMWFWVTMINNVSQIWAIYCLVMFYRATHRELAPIRPISKFLLIKAVVFVTFWQSVVISALLSLGWIKTDRWTTYDPKDVGSGLQNFIICIEMFVASFVFAYVFPPKDYMDPAVERTRGFFGNLKHMFAVRDVVDDVSGVLDSHVERTTTTMADGFSNFIHNFGLYWKRTFRNEWGGSRPHTQNWQPHPILMSSDQHESLLKDLPPDLSISQPQPSLLLSLPSHGLGPSTPNTELTPTKLPGTPENQ
ncbi:hypothetical protein BSKO_09592 [Bryopsis sp. KO-2023]|nr:hypothetical protein BSKO_09592 [Bryopsis sp. KO-2023]